MKIHSNINDILRQNNITEGILGLAENYNDIIMIALATMISKGKTTRTTKVT